MSTIKNKVTNIPVHTDDYYEALASQEQEYLDETVEHLRERELLAAQDSSLSNNPCTFESLIETLHQAAEELITGDSDDPPLSDRAVVEMLRISFKA
jgi:hypothetical protein